MLETTPKEYNYDFFKNVQDELMKQIKSMTASILMSTTVALSRNPVAHVGGSIKYTKLTLQL